MRVEPLPYLLLLILLLVRETEGHWPHDTVDGLEVSEDGKLIFMSARKTLLGSTDSGRSWRPLRQVLTPNYFSLSPYDGSLYVYDAGRMMLRSRNMIDWESLHLVSPCWKQQYGTLRRTMTFTRTGALIAGEEDSLFKENKWGGFREIFNTGLSCPSLSAVANSNIVYANGLDGLMKSTDGGETWSLILPLSEGIVQILAKDGHVFVMKTTGSICRLNTHQDECINVGMPTTTAAEKVRDGSSPPSEMSYYDGSLIVVRRNSFAVYYTKDLGGTWNSRNINDVSTPGHFGKPTAWDFSRTEEITHVENSCIGGYKGLYCSSDGGNSWTYVDTMRKATTTLSVTKARPENGAGFTLAVCTYAAGCYLGAPAYLTPLEQEAKYYDGLFLSPTFDVDGIGMRIGDNSIEFFNGTAIHVPKIVAENTIFCKGVVFSPAYEADRGVFAFGRNIGVVASYNAGQTFYRIFNASGWDVTQLTISRNFATDGTMACLVDPNFDGQKWNLGDNEIQHISVTNDRGQSWRRLVWEGDRFRDIILVEGDPAGPKPIVVAIHVDGRMYAHIADANGGWFPFQYVENTSNPYVRPQGWGWDGLAVSPDGRTLASAWAEGGIMYSRISASPHVASNKNFSKYNPWNRGDNGLPPSVLARMPPVVNVGIARVFNSHIAYSPQYDTDGVMFATDWSHVYMSTTSGWEWKTMFTFQ